MDWEEVEVPEQAPQEQQPLMQIVLRPDNAAEVPTKKSSAMSHAERMLRIDCHKIHTVLLLLNARIRNQWLNDELLHARLLSLTPLPLQTAFAMIHSSKVPEAALRGRMFESSVSRLAEWWSQDFFEVTDEGHIRNITFDTMKQRLIKFVPGFAEQFEDAVAPPEAERDNSRFRLKYKGKGKEKEKQPPSTTPLIDSSDLDLLEDILDNSIETIKSPKSLMKHALMQSGSRDTSAQLFTALCRALAIPARLVVSLQSVPWKAAIGREAKKYPKKTSHVSKGKVEVVENEGNTAPAVSSPMKGGQGHRRDDQPVDKKGKAKAKEEAKPAVKLRKSKSKGDVLGSAQSTSASNKPKKPKHDDPRVTPPTYWTEVFSKADSQWIPVDPIRGFVNKRHVFDPSPSSNSLSSSSSGDNRLVYVLAFEEDGYARDVTRRYAREFGAKVAKVQGGSTTNTNRARVQWWEGVLSLITRPFRLNRDDIEDDELETAQLMEGMPTSIIGFKDHPLYVLPRHLKQNETIYPPPTPALGAGFDSSMPLDPSGSRSHTPELGKFRGEPVYPRSSVVPLKTPENWLRSEGRSIKEGAAPMKYVKLRASTIGRRREIEMIKEGMKDIQEKTKGANGVIGIHVDELVDEERAGTSGNADTGGEIMQGLYARNQTELYVPDPVVDGIIPKNQFGNIDLYVNTMLPRGAVHMPFKGVAKIARKLQIDFAEAVTGFEFRKRKATPVLEGIVVAIENEEVVLEAFLTAEREALEKAQLKQKERVLKQWTRLIHGLRIRQRLQEQYADRPGGGEGTNNLTTHDIAVIESNKKEQNTVNEYITQGNQGDQNLTGVISCYEKGESMEEQERQTPDQDVHHLTPPAAAGFIVQAGDVVQPFRLPKLPKLDSDLVNYSSLGRLPNSNSELDLPSDDVLPMPDFETYDIDVVDDGELRFTFKDPSTTIPKTMHELAQVAETIRAPVIKADDSEDQAPTSRSASRSETVSQPFSAQKKHTRNQPAQPSVPATGSGIAVVSPSENGTSRRKNGRGKQEETNKASPVSARRRSVRLTTRKRKLRRADGDSDDDVSDEEDDNAGRMSSSLTKRSRQSVRTPSAPGAGGEEAGTPSSTRVLRPRVAKK
ncbi:hypothetical protein C8J55DRAFT_484263 [Lentinula edodes]|uniref:Rad4-domain-containing protein n=1 Tax=Lentinula lateritia TaxID=40482 RepID=A0A9W9E1Q8_9AGAR|nr:hypothetical protein C8J55DRAFT_484263 [Lentinula edodes]